MIIQFYVAEQLQKAVVQWCRTSSQPVVQADLNTLDVEVGGWGKTLLGTQPGYGMSMEVIAAIVSKLHFYYIFTTYLRDFTTLFI